MPGAAAGKLIEDAPDHTLIILVKRVIAGHFSDGHSHSCEIRVGAILDPPRQSLTASKSVAKEVGRLGLDAVCFF